jgi:hypothetical protein
MRFSTRQEDIKLQDPELLRFAESDTNETRSVIVELNSDDFIEKPRSSVPRARSPQTGGRSTGSAFGPRMATTAMNELERSLTQLGVGKSMVRLGTAQAYVVSVKPSQLRAISALPMVGAIRSNRTHRLVRVR